jgi:hypothetical protein
VRRRLVLSLSKDEANAHRVKRSEHKVVGGDRFAAARTPDGGSISRFRAGEKS